ncbi:MAG TPA: hypothetical protein VMD91_13230 [Candidatus Sulfotelmatobacter sp.]|nr:hypothetical protein [Candidatus Sulfotelmatobacter sp.]
MRSRSVARFIAIAGLVALGSGCAGSRGSTSMVPHVGSNVPTGAERSVTFKLVVPTKPGAGTTSQRRVPKYVSPSTQSIAIIVNGGTPVAETIQTSGPNCTTPTVISPTTCTISFTAPVGTDTIEIDTYDQPNTGSGPYVGNDLSNTSFLATITAGENNVITATLGGVAASATVTPLANSGYLVGSQSGMIAYGDKSFSVAVVSYDADQNPIVGLGAPSLSLQGSSGLSITGPATGASQNIFTFKNTAFGTSEQLIATVTPLAGTTGQPVTEAIPVETKHVVVYTLNPTNNAAYVFYDENGTAQYSLAVPGGNNAEDGLAVDANGTVAIPISNGTVDVYTNGATSPSYTISGVVSNPGGACFDHEGDLYLTDSNGNSGNGQVEMVTAGGTTTAATYKTDIVGPFACAVDPVDDSLWVLNLGNSSVVQYPHGSTTPEQEFALSGGESYSDESIALDRFGTMYIGENDASDVPQVQVYLLGTHSSDFVLNTYDPSGFWAPTGLAVDVAGNLWVGDFTNGGGGGAVQEYPGYVTASSSATMLPYTPLNSLLGLAVNPSQ